MVIPARSGLSNWGLVVPRQTSPDWRVQVALAIMGDGGHARVQNDPPPPLRMRTKIAARPLSVVVATDASFRTL